MARSEATLKAVQELVDRVAAITSHRVSLRRQAEELGAMEETDAGSTAAPLTPADPLEVLTPAFEAACCFVFPSLCADKDAACSGI